MRGFEDKYTCVVPITVDPVGGAGAVGIQRRCRFVCEGRLSQTWALAQPCRTQFGVARLDSARVARLGSAQLDLALPGQKRKYVFKGSTVGGELRFGGRPGLPQLGSSKSNWRDWLVAVRLGPATKRMWPQNAFEPPPAYGRRWT